jgi:phosphatidylserine/phosphatidylglycerophosphate/cardiolipin synthase-like enzyme
VNFTEQNNNIQLPFIKDELISLVQQARGSIDVAEFYFTLRCADVVNQTLDTCEPGERLLQSLIDSAARGVRLRIAVNGKREKDMNEDLKMLESAGAMIRFVDFPALGGKNCSRTKEERDRTDACPSN